MHIITYCLVSFVSIFLACGVIQSPLALSASEVSIHVTVPSSPQGSDLKSSVLDGIVNAQKSILIMTFNLSDGDVITALNAKAQQGVPVTICIDRMHIGSLPTLLHPSIQIVTRSLGEGHYHHKILVIDDDEVQIGTANFTAFCYVEYWNLALRFKSAALAAKIWEEARCAAKISSRRDPQRVSDVINQQNVELILLPHTHPLYNDPVEKTMNREGLQRIMSLIEGAKKTVSIAVSVFSHKDLARKLVEAKARGVTLSIVAGSFSSEVGTIFNSGGVTVRERPYIHHKLMVVDDETLLNGSGNLSMNTFGYSDESFTLLSPLNQAQVQKISELLQKLE